MHIISISSNGSKYKLQIKNSVLKDAGQYEVQIDNITDKCSVAIKESKLLLLYFLDLSWGISYCYYIKKFTWFKVIKFLQ